MAVSQHNRINSPLVATQEIEGEAVLINFDTGCYYSANRTGAIVLQLLRRDLSAPEISADLASRFAVSLPVVAEGLVSFLSHAEGEGLIVAGEQSSAHSDGPGGSSARSEGEYLPPLLEKFDDLQDLLMLDPIHDVDQAGWPVAPPDRESMNPPTV